MTDKRIIVPIRSHPTNGQKVVTVPRNCELYGDDYVELKSISLREEN